MGRLIGIARREQKRAAIEVLEDAEISEQTAVTCSILKGGTVSIGDEVTVLQTAD